MVLVAGPMQPDDATAGSADPASCIESAETERKAVLLNRAAAELKLGQYPAAVDSASLVLAKDSTCAKAYYRRGQVHNLLRACNGGFEP